MHQAGPCPGADCARRAAMLSTLASVDESRPGTLERILRQARVHIILHDEITLSSLLWAFCDGLLRR